jgi:protein-arginine deiminase
VLRKGSNRSSVGYAQQCLNVFLARHQAGTAGCPVTTPAAAAYATQTFTALRAATQLPLGVDCRFGDSTDRAVRLVQTCWGIGVDGVVGKDTWPILKTFDPAGGGAVTPTGTVFRMMLDTRRDGTLAPAGAGWQWGPTGRGAVVLVNNDDDGATGRPDNEDRVIDTGNDAGELATLIIEATTPVPFGTVVELEASDPQSLRVFGAATPGAAEIIGPHAGARHLFVTLFTSRRELRMEGVRYAGRGFSGEVTLTLRATVPLRPTETHTTTVRIAPWMMPSHLDPAERVYVADDGPDNERFRRDLRSFVTAAGCTLVEIPSSDVWVQDCMEFGFASVPGRTLRTVLRAPRDRPLRTAARGLLTADLGYVEQAALGNSTFDSTGNLEATPPVVAGSTRYPFGRVYYGRSGSAVEDINPLTREFLVGQQVQRPIELDTSWLTVGHVDEVISFVPAPSDPGFKMLVASPKRAYALLDRLARRNGATRMLKGRSLRTRHLDPAEVRKCVDPALVPPFPAKVDVERTVSQFLALADDFNPELKATYFVLHKCGRPAHVSTTLRRYNAGVQTHIDRMRTRMRSELGLPESAVVEIPAVFMPNPKMPSHADAFIPGMVNMLVVNGHCIVPKPFGPVINGVDQLEDDVRKQLSGLGLTISFLDCWEEYHVALGEVHCATNTLRTAGPTRWWEVRP